LTPFLCSWGKWPMVFGGTPAFLLLLVPFFHPHQLFMMLHFEVVPPPSPCSLSPTRQPSLSKPSSYPVPFFDYPTPFPSSFFPSPCQILHVFTQLCHLAFSSTFFPWLLSGRRNPPGSGVSGVRLNPEGTPFPSRLRPPDQVFFPPGVLAGLAPPLLEPNLVRRFLSCFFSVGDL